MEWIHPDGFWDLKGCVSIQGPHPFQGCIAETCSLLFPDVKDPPDGSFTAQRVPRFIGRWIFFSELVWRERKRQLQRIHI